jgi:branched-chain amino acid transport system substrate-binding protein
VQGHTTHGIWGIGEALKALGGKPGDKVSVKALAFAMEKVTVETSMGPVKMRADDHQALIPLAVSVVSKDAKYKTDGTPLGFKTIKLLTGEQASGAVSPACKMVRPTV